MTIPDRKLLFLAAALVLLLPAAIVDPSVVIAVALADVALLLVCYAQGRMLARCRIVLERDDRCRCQVGRPLDVHFRIENRGSRPVSATVRQRWPDSFDGESDHFETFLGAGEVVVLALTVTPTRRGRFQLPPAVMDVEFASGLARRRMTFSQGGIVAVYPDLAQLNAYDTLRSRHALSHFGIHQRRKVGSGREFEHLRDYCPDDEYRDINWTATARRRRPVTNVYQVERSQEVMLCVDAGRMMGNPVGAGTTLDAAVNACLLLGHACRRNGDRTGLAVFRDTVSLFLKPKAGAATINRITQELVDLDVDPVFPSYAALITAIRGNQKRRCMVFIFTDLNDPQLASDLAAVLPLLSRRHVVVVVGLRDPLLNRKAFAKATTREEMFEVFAARELADERDVCVRDLIKAGVHVLEADVDSLSVKAVNTYLSLRARQLL